MTVHVSPMPRTVRVIPERWRPLTPPMFDAPPTDADRKLARDLWRALDLEARRWYQRSGACASLNLTARDLGALRGRGNRAERNLE